MIRNGNTAFVFVKNTLPVELRLRTKVEQQANLVVRCVQVVMQLPHRSFREFGSRFYFDYHFVVDQHLELVGTEPIDFVIERNRDFPTYLVFSIA